MTLGRNILVGQFGVHGDDVSLSLDLGLGSLDSVKQVRAAVTRGGPQKFHLLRTGELRHVGSSLSLGGLRHELLLEFPDQFPGLVLGVHLLRPGVVVSVVLLRLVNVLRG